MGIKKKKNIIILTICVVISFTLYQLYFFLTITSETANNRIITMLNHGDVKEAKHSRSEADRFINENGILRGVIYSYMPKYRPDSKFEFKCLKSEQKIPFENVNDDYCDCEDETDEPSTNACTEGVFYCDTQHRNKLVSLNHVPSGKVNDGICDCCDGSDEWLHVSNKKLLSQSSSNHFRYYLTKCQNNCE